MAGIVIDVHSHGIQQLLQEGKNVNKCSAPIERPQKGKKSQYKDVTDK